MLPKYSLLYGSVFAKGTWNRHKINLMPLELFHSIQNLHRARIMEKSQNLGYIIHILEKGDKTAVSGIWHVNRHASNKRTIVMKNINANIKRMEIFFLLLLDNFSLLHMTLEFVNEMFLTQYNVIHLIQVDGSGMAEYKIFWICVYCQYKLQRIRTIEIDNYYAPV